MQTLGAQIIVHDPKFDNSVDIEELYKTSDIITFHTPTLDKIIGKKQLKIMKDDVIIINTSRGTLFNEKELYDVLSTNNKMSMGIDVYENEPYLDGDLLLLDNVLLTPHIGSFTSKARKEMEKESVENIIKYL
jgi:phosphoglycerate dehydrogenase-like enzyme